jgi:hypothetical protein
MRAGRQRDLALHLRSRSCAATTSRTRAPPWLHIHVQKLSLLQDAQTVKTLVDAGLKLSARHQREYFNQPAPSGPDDELQPPVKNALDPTSKPASCAN